MNITSDALVALVLMMPGFIYAGILNSVVVRRAKSQAAILVEALVASFLVYLVLHALGCEAVSMTELRDSYKPTIGFNHLPHAIALACGFSVVSAICITNDLHMKVLRKLRVTASTARVNTWLDVFIDQRGDIVVTYADGRRLTGWPAYYSNSFDEGLVYLKRPAWLNEENEPIDLESDGILLAWKEGIESITFMQSEASAPVQKGKS